MPATPESEAPAFSLDPKVAKDFGRFAGGFWSGSTRRRAWLLTLGLAASLIVSTGATVAMNHWNRWFFDALERKDVATVTSAVFVFLGIVAAMAAIGVAIVLTRETLQVRWRQWLVEQLLVRWLERQRFYHLNVTGLEPPNPEYRISDDTRWATEVLVDLGIGLLSAVVGAIAFISILWQVGGAITLGGITIPAYMVIAALAYGITASLLMAWVGKPLVGRVGAKNEAEGYFRFAMMRLRDNPESVALMGGGTAERHYLGRFYSAVVNRWLAIVKSHGQVTWITNVAGPMKPIVPLLFAAPKYLSGDLTLGQVTQLAAAFVEVQIAISWVVDNYNRIAEWYASARRVMDVVYACDSIDGQLDESERGIHLNRDGEEHAAPGLRIEGLEIADAAGRPLVNVAALGLRPDERVFISGESSTGKTMLVRAITGLWPTGRGAVYGPGAQHTLVVPQKGYMPLGTLAEILAYPESALLVRSDVERALASVGLEHLAGRLDERVRWDQLLSSGERQRLAIARVLLHRPSLLILDDALSALEESGQRSLLAAIARELPRTAVLSLGQRFSPDGFHNRHVVLERGPNGARIEAASPTVATSAVR